MRLKNLLIAALSFLALPNTAISQQRCEATGIIIQLRPGVQPEALVRQLNAKWPTADFILKKTLSKRFNAYLLRAACERFSDLDLLRNEVAVVSALWDQAIEFRRDSVPNDTLFPTQWNLEKIRLPEVWSVAQGGRTTSGKEIVVAVLDNGFDLLHPDLQGNIWRNEQEDFDGQDNDFNDYPDDVYGWNFHDNNPLFPLTSSHGTNVLGVIGAEGNNVIGVSGMNWKVKMMLVHLENLSEAIPALEYVLEMRERYNASGGLEGAFVVVTNGSWGAPDPVFCSEFPLWGALYDSLGAAGVLSVAATTNNHNYDIDKVGDMPTSCPSEYLITVTASNNLDEKIDGLGFGKTTIDLAAPGDSIPTTTTGGTYRGSFSGASAACPQVSGPIALFYSLPCADLEELAEADPAAAARLVRDAILKGVEKLPSLKNRTTTGGRLNVYNSMKYLHSYCIAKPTEREAGRFDEIYIDGRGFVHVYPNPVQDKLTIAYSILDFQRLKFRVYNMLGQEMLPPILQQSSPFEPQVFEIDVSDWPSGTYFVNIFDFGQKISAKFVKL